MTTLAPGSPSCTSTQRECPETARIPPPRLRLSAEVVGISAPIPRRYGASTQRSLRCPAGVIAASMAGVFDNTYRERYRSLKELRIFTALIRGWAAWVELREVAPSGDLGAAEVEGRPWRAPASSPRPRTNQP